MLANVANSFNNSGAKQEILMTETGAPTERTPVAEIETIANFGDLFAFLADSMEAYDRLQAKITKLEAWKAAAKGLLARMDLTAPVKSQPPAMERIVLLFVLAQANINRYRALQADLSVDATIVAPDLYGKMVVAIPQGNQDKIIAHDKAGIILGEEDGAAKGAVVSILLDPYLGGVLELRGKDNRCYSVPGLLTRVNLREEREFTYAEAFSITEIEDI